MINIKSNQKMYLYLFVLSALLIMLLFLTSPVHAEELDSEDLRWYWCTFDAKDGYSHYYVGLPVGYCPVALSMKYDSNNDIIYCLGILDSNGDLVATNFTGSSTNSVFDSNSGFYRVICKTRTHENVSVAFPYGTMLITGVEKYTGKWSGLTYYSPAYGGTTNLPIVEYTGVSTTKGEFVQSECKSANEVLLDMQSSTYPCPIVDSVKTVDNESSRIHTLNFKLQKNESSPVSIDGYVVVHCADTSGTDFTYEIPLEECPSGFELFTGTSLPVGTWSLNGSDDWYCAFHGSSFYDYMKNAGKECLTIYSVKLRCRYLYNTVNGTLKSKYCSYTYDYLTGALSGTVYDNTTGTYIEPEPIMNPNASGSVTITDSDNSMQSLVDTLSNSIKKATTSMQLVFNTILGLFSSCLGFVGKIGEIFSLVLGSSLGAIVSGALLCCVVLRLLGR